MDDMNTTVLVCFRCSDKSAPSMHRKFVWDSRFSVDCFIEGIRDNARERPSDYGVPHGYEPVQARRVNDYSVVWQQRREARD